MSSGGAVKRKRPADDGDADDSAAGAGAAPQVFTVYMEGLPYTSSEDDIREFLYSGGVEEDPSSIRAPRYQDSGRLMGYAHVDFSSKAAAKKALQLDGKHIGGRFIKIQIAKQLGAGADSMMAFTDKARPAGCTTLFVKGLPYETDEEAVKAVFSKYGSVRSVRLARWNHTDRLKGFGYVDYEHGYSCEAAVKAYREGIKGGSGGKITVGGRIIHLDYETGAPKSSFKTTSGQNFIKTEEAKPILKDINKKKHHSSSSGSSSNGAKEEGKEEKKAKKSKKHDSDDDDDDAPVRQPATKKVKRAKDDEDDDDDAGAAGSSSGAAAAGAGAGEKKKRKKKRGKGGSKKAQAKKAGDGDDDDGGEDSD